MFIINRYCVEDILLTLDNSSCHWSLDINTKLKQLGFDVEYLPPYTPIFAPVEILCKVIKSKIRASNEYIYIDFSKEIGMQFIYNTFKELDVEKLSTISLQFTRSIFKT